MEASWARWGASPEPAARIRTETRRRGPRWTNCNLTGICATRGVRVREVQSDRIVLADMVYSVNWLPLGGFVRLSGENNPEAPRSLARRGLGQRAIVLAAGSAMNAIFPVVAFAIILMIPHTELVGGTVQITAVAPGSPAEASGLMAGDRVLAIDGRTLEAPDELVREVRSGAGSEMLWSVEREGAQRLIPVTPRVNPPAGQGATGIAFTVVGQIEERREPPWRAFPNRLGAPFPWASPGLWTWCN